ncbi:MAG: hypothetical protein DMF52_13340 [Acidobacteria bacterium]|nr:MAG: hypothetical protein DMF52_13340 [Acidobacteriota bacterium]
MALATVITVFVISYAYSRVIEQFPHGGGGYVVATKLLGPRAGVVSGCALLVDYILTITVSVAAGGDAIFDLLPRVLRGNFDLKIACEVAVLAALLIMNLRGVKESVEFVMPVFLVFVVTHLILIVVGIGSHASRVPEVFGQVSGGLREGLGAFGAWGLLAIFVRAFALGGGTFTGIEAVSNGIAIMREPKVQTGRRTMIYMATSLAFTAGGILVCYLLFDVQSFFDLPAREQIGRTLNGVLAERFASGWSLAGFPIGPVFVKLTIASEAARVRHLLPDRDGHVPLLVLHPPPARRLGPPHLGPRPRSGAVSDDPRRHGRGEIRAGSLEDARDHLSSGRRVRLGARPLPLGPGRAAPSRPRTPRSPSGAAPRGRARCPPADRRPPGARVRRHGHPPAPVAAEDVPGFLQERDLRLRRRDRLGPLQGQGGDQRPPQGGAGVARQIRRAGAPHRLERRLRHHRDDRPGRGDLPRLRRSRKALPAHRLLRR